MKENTKNLTSITIKCFQFPCIFHSRGVIWLAIRWSTIYLPCFLGMHNIVDNCACKNIKVDWMIIEKMCHSTTNGPFAELIFFLIDEWFICKKLFAILYNMLLIDNVKFPVLQILFSRLHCRPFVTILGQKAYCLFVDISFHSQVFN